MSTRITQLGAEVIYTDTPNARITQLGAEVVFTNHNSARITQLGVEFIYRLSSERPRSYTQIIG